MLAGFDIIIQAATFIAVFAFVLFAQRVVSGRLSINRRLTQDASTAVSSRSSVIKSDTVTNQFLAWVQSVTTPKGSVEGGKLKRDLALAGIVHPAASVWYVIIRFSLAIGLPLLVITLASALGKPLQGLGGIVFPLILCATGLIAPKAFVDNRANARRSELENQFPDALDLMVVCVEAGLGLEAAFVRVAEEVRESHPRIAEEFGRLADELSAGRGRAEALRNLADRVNVDSVKSFVALLIQTDTLGVSIAQSLRTYSTEMREARYMRAEEKAMRIPVLMTVPIVACFMPVIMVALLLPPAIDIIRVFLPALANN